ncbi:radical SAM protein [Bacteroides nordii]|uniref:radical SAM protein n=1 Tax=Bacteroides nordii TaxID=291645 RepID=UPI00399A4E8F
MKRLSSYTICIELKTTNKFMLVHGYTGAIDILDRKIILYLKENEDALSEETFPFLDETWKNLQKRGYITSKTKEEEHLFVKKMADLLHRQNKSFQKHFGFLVSYNCNFRCPYCYESKISDFGSGWSKRTFNRELIDEVYNAMLLIEPHKQLHAKSLLLYGGEPLLKENREVIKYIVEKGCSLGHTFSTITNGYDLDSFLDLLAPDKIASLQITVDGCKETHDRTRIHKDVKSTFDKIVDNIKLALERNIHVSIRMNCNEKNIAEVNQLKAIFERCGFYNYKGFYFYSALIYDYLQEYKKADERANSLKFMERQNFINKFKEHSNQNFEDEGFERKIKKAIMTGNKILLSPTYCAAFSSSYLFDPCRNIYSCWETLGDPNTVVGSYDAEKVIFNANLDKLHSFNVGKSEKCSRCKYVFLCRGGCPVRKNDQLCAIIPKLFETSANKAYFDYMKSI